MWDLKVCGFGEVFRVWRFWDGLSRSPLHRRESLHQDQNIFVLGVPIQGLGFRVKTKAFCKLQTMKLVSSSLASGGSFPFSYLGPRSVSFILLVHGLSYMYSVRFTSAPCFSAHQLLSRGPDPTFFLSLANRG